MRHLPIWSRPIFTLLLAGCGSPGDTVMGEPSKPVRYAMVADHYKEAIQPLRRDADVRAERGKIIFEILRAHPELESEGSIIPSLRGEASWMILAFPPEYADIAPLLARGYHLLQLEMRDHPSRFQAQRRQNL